MSLRTKIAMICAAVALSAGTAQALTVDDVIQSYTDAGFSAIEVRETAGTIKVEAIKAGVKLELVYDKASGEVLQREQRALGAEGVGQGSGLGLGDDDNGDHSGGSDDGAGHDAGDDHGGSDDGAGHDAGDDHGGSDHGAGHDAGDDHGGDDSGSDDSGNDDGDDH